MREIPQEWKHNNYFSDAILSLKWIFTFSKPLQRMISKGGLVIDLGCGSPQSDNAENLPQNSQVYQPWFLRAAWALGAVNAFGIVLSG